MTFFGRVVENFKGMLMVCVFAAAVFLVGAFLVLPFIVASALNGWGDPPWPTLIVEAVWLPFCFAVADTFNAR